jgi:N-methylhydantoinase A
VAGNLQALSTPVYDRDALQAGHQLTGPALLVQLDATTVIPPGWSGEVGEAGDIVLKHS